MGDEIFKFKDEKPVPDKIFDYPVADLEDEKVPIVIDNGESFYWIQIGLILNISFIIYFAYCVYL